MKKILSLVFLTGFLMFLNTGCSTVSSQYRYDATTGKLINKSVTESDPVDKVMKEMKVKDIAWWNCGWFFIIECTLTDPSTYMPAIKFAGGKANTGHISLTKDSKQDMSKCIAAMQTPIELTVMREGIKVSEKSGKKTVSDTPVGK